MQSSSLLRTLVFEDNQEDSFLFMLHFVSEINIATITLTEMWAHFLILQNRVIQRKIRGLARLSQKF